MEVYTVISVSFLKCKRVILSISNKRSLVLFSLIYSDIWEPSYIPNIYEDWLFVSFVNDCIKVTKQFLLKLDMMLAMSYLIMIKNSIWNIHKKLCIDNAKYFFNHTVSSFFHWERILHESFYVHTSQRNGVAECKNSYILTTNRVFLFQKKNLKKILGQNYFYCHLHY